MPRDGLSRPVLVEIAVSPEGEAADAEAGEEVIVKTWIGFLSPELAGSGIVGDPEEDTEIAEFGEELGLRVHLPEESLLSVADEHFAFVTAESGAPAAEPPKKKRGKPDAYEARFGKLEAAMEEIRISLASVISLAAPAPAKPATKPAVEPRVLKPVLPTYPGLDASAVAAARAAGLSEEHLARLASVAGQQPPLKETPKLAKKAVNVLSESEDEEEEAVLGIGGSADQSGAQIPAVERAVVDLAKIVKSIQKEKSNKTGIESILDRVDGGGNSEASGSQSSGARGKAAAYKKLKAALQDNPEWIYSNIEALMDEDFMQMRAAPGAQHLMTTSRAWVEHRSRHLHYQSSIRATWMLAGIHDALKAGRTNEARARAALGILAYDQSSLDGGNWQLAQELCLELAPPFSSFQNKRAPDASEQSWSRLADERILDLALWRLKDKDSFNESRKRLSNPGKTQRNPGGEGAKGGPGAKADAKRKAKAKPKAAAGQGQAQEAQS